MRTSRVLKLADAPGDQVLDLPLKKTPNHAEAAEHARGHAIELINELRRIALDPKVQPIVRVVAIRECLDRGLGKPMQAQLNLNAQAPTLDDQTAVELARRLMNTVYARPTALQPAGQAEQLPIGSGA